MIPNFAIAEIQSVEERISAAFANGLGAALNLEDRRVYTSGAAWLDGRGRREFSIPIIIIASHSKKIFSGDNPDSRLGKRGW